MRQNVHRNATKDRMTEAGPHGLRPASVQRQSLLELIEEKTAEASETNSHLALLCIDIDNFKVINFAAGYDVGNRVLLEVSRRIESFLRPCDVVVRTGDDEFMLILPSILHQDHARLAAQMVLDKLRDPIIVSGHELDVTVSIGTALSTEAGSDAEELWRKAAMEMFEAKAKYSDHVIQTERFEDLSIPILNYKKELHHAIVENSLMLHYQPKFEILTGRLLGSEALARWNHPEYGYIPPGEFAGVAEHTGLIYELTDWVLNTALCQSAAWQLNGVPLSVSINVSTRDLQRPELPELIDRALETWQVAPGRLILEITETAMMLDRAHNIHVLNQLSELGVWLSIDDFGSGYSSLSYLQELPVNELKIDKQFVVGMAEADSDSMIVRTVIELGHNFGYTVTAEGVEKAEAYEMLGQLGCDMAQGFYLSRPLAPDNFEDYMKTYRPNSGAA